MTVKEFLDVVNEATVYKAVIYERRWSDSWNAYDNKCTGKIVHSKKDLEPYYDCKLHYFALCKCTHSEIYIQMP